MWQKTKGHKWELNPDTPGYVKHNNRNITTTLLRITNEQYLVVYISLKRTHNPKWKLFGCRMGGDLGHSCRYHMDGTWVCNGTASGFYCCYCGVLLAEFVHN